MHLNKLLVINHYAPVVVVGIAVTAPVPVKVMSFVTTPSLSAEREIEVIRALPVNPLVLVAVVTLPQIPQQVNLP